MLLWLLFHFLFDLIFHKCYFGKKDVLFKQVPYFAKANNLAINDVVLGNKRDDLLFLSTLL